MRFSTKHFVTPLILFFLNVLGAEKLRSAGAVDEGGVK